MSDTASGRFVVVGTPIGNLEDVTPRMVSALRDADLICCEDTRRTRKLLSALAVPAPRLMRLDAHSEQIATPSVVEAVRSGRTVALVSDAGMPTISDPGHHLVSAVAEAGLAVGVVPGPTAVSCALALSGLPASDYRFLGFIPRKGRDRSAVLDRIRAERATVVIYEAPSRVGRTVEDLQQVCGPDRRICAAREITKLHEEVHRATLAETSAWLSEQGSEPRGEWVLVLAGAGEPQPAGPVGDSDISAALQSRLAAGRDRRQAIAEVADVLAVPKRRVYDVAVSLKDRPHQGG